jgi:hypothetical protein
MRVCLTWTGNFKALLRKVQQKALLGKVQQKALLGKALLRKVQQNF